MSDLRPRLRAVLGFLVSVLFVLPFYWAVVASFGSSEAGVQATIEWWPSNPRWDNYAELFRVVPMARYTLNSLLVVLAAVPITLLVASLAGFGMSQLEPELRQQMVRANVVLLLVPGAAVWLFRFQIINWLGLLDSLWALVLPAFAASNPLFVLLYYWAFRRLPDEMYEAARLDGAGALTSWWRLALPLTVPTTIGVVVLTFALYWGDFISPVLYIFDPLSYTLPIGLQIIKQLGFQNVSLLMAAAVFITLPVLVLFFVLQRYFLHEWLD